MTDGTDIVERLKLRADALRSEGQAMRAYLEDQAAAEITRLRAALDAMTAERDAARAKALDSLAAEYLLTPPLYNGDMQNGRRDAVRGIAIRLGVYADLDDAIETAIRAMKEPKG